MTTRKPAPAAKKAAAKKSTARKSSSAASSSAGRMLAAPRGKTLALAPKAPKGRIGPRKIEPATVKVGGEVVDITRFRTEVLIAKAGSLTAAAELLGVSKSQPSRWRSGTEAPSPEKARLLNDLEHVYSRAAMIFAPSVIKQWMNGSNDYLEGARPIDVLKTRGPAEVLDALDAATQIAYGG